MPVEETFKRVALGAEQDGARFEPQPPLLVDLRPVRDREPGHASLDLVHDDVAEAGRGGPLDRRRAPPHHPTPASG